jgi:hypothetical protein
MYDFSFCLSIPIAGRCLYAGLILLLTGVLLSCSSAPPGVVTTPFPTPSSTVPQLTAMAPATLAAATPSPRPTYAFGVIDADVCAALPIQPFAYDETRSQGDRCLLNGESVALADAACMASILAQGVCEINADPSQADVSLCIPGYEINCRRHLSQALQGAVESYPAPQSLCSGLTVGGIGYSDRLLLPYTFDRGCLENMNNIRSQTARCTFLGSPVAANIEMCRQLTQCVEPKLLAAFPHAGYEQAVPVLAFPSGIQALHIDLSCSDEAAVTSLHRQELGCRAIDINVERNYGNLRIESRLAPVSTIPPEFVAIMEECGLLWGGRYTNADNVPQGCDPMEFVYAPACIEQ